MSTKSEQAVELFKNNYNCAQSVFSAFAHDLGLSKDVCLKIATPFGAGIVYRQETCGAVTGALMALGLKYGRGENEPAEQKTIAYDKARLFIDSFIKQHGTICCKELLGGEDMSTPEGLARINELDLFRTHCARYVKDAVEIAQLTLGK